jgi:hypothetical protein
LSDFHPNLSEQAAFRMTAGSGNAPLTLLWVHTPDNAADTEIYYQGISIDRGRLQSSFEWLPTGVNDPAVFNPKIGQFSVSDLQCLPGEYGADAVMLRDQAGTLYLIEGYHQQTPAITPITGTAATQPSGAISISAGCDCNGALNLFAVEAGGSNALWYLQQPDVATALNPTGWVNLGGKLFGVGCRTAMLAGPELYCAEMGLQGPTVYHMDRSLSNPVWSTRKVAAPVASSGDPQNIASYSMELTTLDSYSNPTLNTWLTVESDQAATLIWNQIAYHVGPNSPLQIQTDGGGQATVQLQGDSLKPPVITFGSSDGTSTVSRWCQGDVVQVMDEEDALEPLPDSVAPTLQTVSGQTLVDQKLFSSKGYDTQDDVNTAAANTASAINSAGQWLNNSRNSASGGLLDTSAIATPHWQIDFTHAEGPRFREMALDEARAIIRHARDPDTPDLLGGALGSLFGDVAHFFKKEWQKLHTFSASLENEVLTITLAAEEGVQSFVISTVKEAGAALETVFAKIKQIADDIYNVIAEVIAFLKMLFDWDDILNTHKVLSECVTQTLANLNSSISDPSQFFDLIMVDFLNAAEDLVLFIMDGIEYVIEAGLSLASQAIEAFLSLISTPIDIPVITWIWKNIITHDDPFTLLDLVCLIFAIPGTILYKLIGSKLLQPNEPMQAPFSSSDATTIATVGLPWPAIPASSVNAPEYRGEAEQLSALLLANMKCVSAFCLTFGAGWTAYADFKATVSQEDGNTKPTSPTTFMTVVSLVLRGVTFGCGAPVGLLQKPKAQWSKADQWAMRLWTTRGGALLIDTIFAALSPSKGTSKWYPKTGPALKSVLGLGQLAVGTVACVYQVQDSNYSTWVVVNDVVRPIPACFKFLMYFDLDTYAWDPVPILPCIDVVAGIGSSVTQIGATVYTYQHSR